MAKIKRADLLTGLGLCALAVYVYLEASGMPAARRGLGPGGYPKFIAIGLFVLGLVLAIQSFVAGMAPVETRAFDHRRLGRMAAFAALSLAYAFALRPLGFILATIVFLFAAVNFFGYRRRGMAALFSIGLSLIIYAIFRHIFLVLLPTGSIF